MNEKHSPALKLFLTKAKFPVNKIIIRSAVALATQIAELLKLTPQKQYNLEVAVEEAFSNAILHFAKETLHDERIFLKFTLENNFLVISVREYGIPFTNNTNNEHFTPDSLAGLEKTGLGIFLMEQSMDSVEFLIHGRKGKETLMKMRLNVSSIPQELIPDKPEKRKKRRHLVKESICREATIDDLAEICRLAWRCYGYTHEDILYNLDILTEKFTSGEVKPLVFFDSKSNNMIAHEALKYHDPSVGVPELGLAFVDPAFRCPNLTRKFASEALKICRKNGDRGIFDCSVTTHIYSQKGIQEYLGSNPCAIMFAIAAAGMNAKKLTTVKQEKGSVVNHYYALDKSSHTVYIPTQHKNMIGKIYNWLDLPREFAPTDFSEPEDESSVLYFELPEELNVAFIIINTIGKNTEDEILTNLKNCQNQNKDAVYLFIPTGNPHAPHLINKCENAGFFFAGIMPHIHNGDDRIILQSININLDYSKIKVYGKKSAELLEYIITEKNNLKKPGKA